jgi:hypothetical protein
MRCQPSDHSRAPRPRPQPGPDELLDELQPEIVHRAEAWPFDALLDRICERADLTYDWLSPYLQDPEHRRTSFGWDLDRLIRIFDWAGIAERGRTAVEPDRWESTRERLVGGTVRLTPVGRWWLDASVE